MLYYIVGSFCFAKSQLGRSLGLLHGQVVIIRWNTFICAAYVWLLGWMIADFESSSCFTIVLPVNDCWHWGLALIYFLALPMDECSSLGRFLLAQRVASCLLILYAYADVQPQFTHTNFWLPWIVRLCASKFFFLVKSLPQIWHWNFSILKIIPLHKLPLGIVPILCGNH